MSVFKVIALVIWGFGAGALYATDAFMSEECDTDRIGVITLFLWPALAIGIGVVWLFDPDAIEPGTGECQDGAS